MKRIVLAALLFALAVSASAADRVSIAILEITEEGRPGEIIVGSALAGHLRTHLRKAGFDAFTISATLDDVRDEPREDVDFYVELAPWDADSNPYGGVGVNGPHAHVDVAVVRSSIIAQLRVYDARTLEVLGRHELSERSTAVLPLGLGLGDRRFVSGWIALPFAQWIQYRRLVGRMARDAAHRVADIVRTPA